MTFRIEIESIDNTSHRIIEAPDGITAMKQAINDYEEIYEEQLPDIYRINIMTLE